MKLLLLLLVSLSVLAADPPRPLVRVGQLRVSGAVYREEYPGALESLLKHVSQNTNINLDTVPVDLANFQDPRLAECPFVYANLASREWQFEPAEAEALRKYLENGGFLYIDAGITASFLRGTRMAQHHSYAEWEAAPELKQAFAKLFPANPFTPLKRTDPLYSAFYQGLPDTSLLPISVREYTIREKWPDGTYSAVALRLRGRIAVLCTPIVAMGWARNSIGQWQTNIQFRILETTAGLQESLGKAAYGGERFEVAREDAAKDIVFCQEPGTPAWCQHPDGSLRIFRYYSSAQISDFAHQFYTRLGTNILVYALCQ